MFGWAYYKQYSFIYQLLKRKHSVKRKKQRSYKSAAKKSLYAGFGKTKVDKYQDTKYDTIPTE